jgi:putative GTP pyrophosphokinase
MPDSRERLSKSLSNDDELFIRRDYHNRLQMFEVLGISVRNVLEAALKRAVIPFHSVKFRVKSINSVLEKITTKDYGPDLNKFTDIVGIRVICLSPSHLETVTNLLQSEFKVLEVVDKRPQPDSEQFGYSSIHLICKLGETERGKLTEFVELSDIKFEIQVRTILQEAWSEMDHRLVYKSEIAAPPAIRRLITKLSIALENADAIFQEIFDKRERYIGDLKKADSARFGEESLNLDTLNEVMRRVYPWAEGWQEDRDPQYLAKSANALLRELASVGIKSIGELTKLLEKWKDQVCDASKMKLKTKGEKDGTGGFTGWQLRTGHFFLPLGLVRESLSRGFPDYVFPTSSSVETDN